VTGLEQYFDWLHDISDGALNFSFGVHIIWWVALVLVFFVIRQLIFLRFFLLPTIRVDEKDYNQHGDVVKRPIYDFLIMILSITVGPIVEEMLFRGPILYFLIQGKTNLALGITFVGAILFGLIHLTNIRTHSDNTKKATAWPIIWNMSVGGLLYGFIVMITRSLWPAILLHALWNILVLVWMFASTTSTNRFVSIANSLQRTQNTSTIE